MPTRITNRAGALVTAIVVLIGVAMLPRGRAAADPSPDDQFLALLDQKGIPALDNVPSLISAAHRICHQLDGGMPTDAVVDDLRERAFKAGSAGGQYPPDRVARTIARFISASVEAYCPNNQPKITSLEAMAYRLPRPGEPTVHAVSVRQASNDEPFPLGETAPPAPPELPPPPPPTAQIMAPPPPVATPTPRRQSPPPAQGPQPGSQEGPPAAPAPGDPPGSGGDTPPATPTPPGRVRLAP